MSAFPQILWRPSPKDVVAEFAPRTAHLRFSNSQAATVVTANSVFFVPVDQVFLLRHALVQCDPGAGQVLQNMTLNILQDTTSICQLIGWSGPAPLVAAFPSTASWQGEIVLTNTEALLAAGTYDLGGVANVTALSISGIFVPRGNWQR